MNPQDAVAFGGDYHGHHKFMADIREFGRAKLAEMNDLIVENHNAVVGKKDTFWFLGDLSFGAPDEIRKFFKALNGVKHLIKGNHDKPAIVNLPWASVHDLKMISVQGQKIVLCHYPLLTWQNAHRGTWHIHGHTHDNLRAEPSTRLDVGIDCSAKYGMKPLSPFTFEDVSRIMSTRTYDFVDHHDGGEAFRNGQQQNIG
jgi:calcineurin-like phosphoesterase family protein